MELVKHYFDDNTIVGEMIDDCVEEYRKRRRAIPPSEFKEILHKIANSVIQYH